MNLHFCPKHYGVEHDFEKRANAFAEERPQADRLQTAPERFRPPGRIGELPRYTKPTAHDIFFGMKGWPNQSDRGFLEIA
jgi:hypothetical protein